MAKTTVPSQYIADNAITTAKIAANAITAAQIAGGAIVSVDLGDNSITIASIAGNAVGSSEIAKNAVGSSEIAKNSVDSSELVSGSIDTVHLSADAVTGAKIADDSIDSEHYVDGSIDTAHIADSQVTNAKLANSSVTVNSNSLSLGGTLTLDTDDIGEGVTNQYFTNARAQSAISAGTGITVSSGEISIAGNAITATMIAKNAVGSSEIAADSVGSSEIAANAVSTSELASTAAPTFASITTTGDGDIGGNLTVTGNLQVDGTTTTINSTNLSVDDLNITVAAGAANAAAANGAGITVDGASATFTYNSGNDDWNINKPLRVENSGALLRRYVSAWSYPIHDIIYSSYLANTGDYTYLKAAGNSAGPHGAIITGDSVFAVGTTDVELGGMVNSATAPLTNTWLYANSAGLNINGTLTTTGDVGIGTTSPNNLLTLEDGDLQIHETSTSDPLVQLSVGGTQASPTQSWVLRVDNSDSDKFQLLDQTDSRVVLTADGSGNVGIGTTSPTSAKLEIAAANSQLKLTDTDDSTYTHFSSSGNILAIRQNSLSANHVFLTSAGRLGLGTNNPFNDLHIHGQTSGTGPVLQMTNDTGDCRIFFGQNSTTASANAQGQIRYSVANNNLMMYTSGSERMRIDSSGNLLVGTTTTLGASDLTGGETGFAARSNGLTIVSRSAGTVLLANRQTSDGDIAVFQKDGSTVGSIGASSGDVYIGTGDTGLKFNDSLNQIYAWDTSTNSVRDGLTELGASTARFSALNLANGIVIDRADSGTQVQIAMKTAGSLRTQLTSNFGDNKFYLYHAGGNRVVVDGSGNMLVGVTSLNRLGSGSNQPSISIANTGTGAANSAEIYLYNAATASTRVTGAFCFGTSGTSASEKRSAIIASTLSADSSTNVSGKLNFYTNNAGTLAERMTIDSSGNVGIGTASPKQKLQVNNGTILAGQAATNGSVALYNEYSSGNGDYLANWGTQYSSGAAAMSYGVRSTSGGWVSTYDNFSGQRGTLLVDGELEYLSATSTSVGTAVGSVVTSLTSRFKVDTDGKVIIGDYLNFSNRTDSSFIKGDDGTGHLSIYCDNTFEVYNYNGGWVRHMALGDTGDLVIGGSTGSVSRAIIVDPVNDTGASRGFRLRTGTNNATAHAGTFWECHDGTNGELGIKMGSNLYFYMANNGVMSGDFNDTSDRNLKENITTITETGGLPIVTQLNPVIFDWKDQSKGDGHAGFIAQEVEEILPNDVSGQDWYEGLDDEDKPGKSINVTAIVAHAVKAIQQLKEENDSLKARIEALET